MTSVFPRMSRQATLAAIVVAIVLTVALFASKDLYHKLDVMTASNAGYQRITDAQSTQIKKLSEELKDAVRGHKRNAEEFARKRSEHDAKLAKAEAQLRLRRKDVESLRLEVGQLEEDRERLQGEKSQLEVERDQWRDRYDSTLLLLKQQQQQQREVGQQQLGLPSSPNASSSSPSMRRHAAANNILEEPRNAGSNHLALKQFSPPSPVVAEPPAAADGVVAMTLLGQQPDPKRGGGENLDQMIDHVHQDHPELPGPLDDAGHRLDWGLRRQEEENEADDAADGLLLKPDAALGWRGGGGVNNNNNDVVVGFDNVGPSRQQRALTNGHRVLPPVMVAPPRGGRQPPLQRGRRYHGL